MRARLSTLQMRHLGLFVLVAGVVATVVFFGVREAGLVEQAGPAADSTMAESRPATQQQDSDGEQTSEPLTLTLNAPEICEANRARRLTSSVLRENEQGVRVRQRIAHGWRVFEEVQVRWRVEGGTPPYTLTIDGEPRDARAAYNGQFGEASVGCADPSVGTFFEEVSRRAGVTRLYRANPEVDSGWKRIRAVVAHGNGRTSEASVHVYVILNADDRRQLLKGGETYRVYGHLMTVPDEINLRFGEHSSGSGGVSAYSFFIAGTPAYIWLNTKTFEEVGRWLPEQGAQGVAPGIDLSDKLDQFAQSIGQLPNLSRGHE